ncbi:MAG: metallophosphoesterase [Deltaproteobacteria bacterium]|nr:metallophosphoesterase [Deltaproteobacteria bacterium]
MSLVISIAGLLILAFSIWYLPWRIAALLGSKRSLAPFRAALGLIMGCYLIAMHFLIFATGNVLIARLYLVWAIIFVFELYLFVILGLSQILGLVFKKLKLKPKTALLGVVLLALGLSFYQLYRTQDYVLSEYVIPVPGLEAPVRIMHFADLHLGAFRGQPFLRKIVDDAKRMEPDIVIWNGDLASSDLALDESLFELFKEISAEQYFTTGNHEFDININRLVSLLEKAGIVFLRSKMVETHGLQLIGLEYMNGGDSTDFYDAEAKMVTELTIADVLPGISRTYSAPTVVFHHSPVGIRHVSMGEVDVMLTGNTHAGQLSPLTTMFRLTWPNLKSGLRTVGHLNHLVSSGGGDYGAWFRFGTSYEFQVIDLIPG